MILVACSYFYLMILIITNFNQSNQFWIFQTQEKLEGRKQRTILLYMGSIHFGVADNVFIFKVYYDINNIYYI